MLLITVLPAAGFLRAIFAAYRVCPEVVAAGVQSFTSEFHELTGNIKG